MPLPNTASINDVISELSDMQAINQKSELASVIGSPAAASDSVATQIAKFQDAKYSLASNITAKGVVSSGTDSIQKLSDNVSEIIAGSQVLSGSTVSSTSGNTLPFTYYDESTTNSNPYVTVSGLTFKPTRIEVVAWISGVYYLTEYNFSLSDINDSVRLVAFGGNSRPITIYHYKGNTGNAYVTNSGFRLPVNSAGVTYNWKAYL